MPKTEQRMANQLSALEQLIERFPDQEAELREIKDDVAGGKLLPGTPLRTRRHKDEDPSVTRKAKQMRFLEELGTSYPDKSKTILNIKDNLSKGNR